MALESAVALDPTDIDRRDRLATLYSEGDAVDRAILMHQDIVRDDPSRRSSYAQLAELFFKAGRAPQAKACQIALSVLDGKPPAALTEPPPAPRRPLDAEDWARLRHPGEDRMLSALLARLAPFVAAGQARQRKELGLSRDDAVSPDDDRAFAHTLRQVAQVLGMVAPEAHVRREQMQPLMVALCRTRSAAAPVLLVGLPMLGDRRTGGTLVFHAARLLSRLRPERILSLLAPQPAALGQLVNAAMNLDKNEPTQQSLRKALPAVDLDQVKTIGERLRARGIDAEVAVREWLHSADATATRVALALVGDLPTCARLLATEPGAQQNAARAQRVLELLAASISDELILTREHLGTLS